MRPGGARNRAGDKQALRERMLERRGGLDLAAQGAAARGLRDVLLGVDAVAGAGVIAAYVSVGREPGTGPLLEALRGRSSEVLVPALLPDDDLDWGRYGGPDGLAPAARGLLEPIGPLLGATAVLNVQAVLVPALGVDRRGTRLGRGGGSYDRVLARLRAARSTAWVCALLYDGEVLDLPIPREPHDVPVSAAATPSGLHRW